MTQHIGIVACSAEGAALCYRTICTEAPQRMGTYAHPDVTVHTPSLARYAACLDAGHWEGVAEIMLESAEVLARAGADFLICPDNTIHNALDRVTPRSPLPWLHIAEVVAREASARGFGRIGLTGTKWLVDSEVYPQALAARDLAWERPNNEDREELSRIIMDELVCGRFDPASTRRLQAIIGRLADAGCDSVVLGCTELPIVLSDDNLPLPTLDSTRLLARAAIDRALSG
jgi:aspartate racemase